MPKWLRWFSWLIVFVICINLILRLLAVLIGTEVDNLFYTIGVLTVGWAAGVVADEMVKR